MLKTKATLTTARMATSTKATTAAVAGGKSPVGARPAARRIGVQTTAAASSSLANAAVAAASTGRRRTTTTATTTTAAMLTSTRAALLSSSLPSSKRRKQQQQQPRRNPRSAVVVAPRALDAALPFDGEARAAARAAKAEKLSVGIVGFGTFGRFLAARLVKAGHDVSATSRTDYSRQAGELGVRFLSDADDFCEQHPDVVVLATSILSAGAVLRSLPAQRLKRSTLFVDVLSVKEYPKRAMLASLPKDFDVLCTHPMFGPDSGRGSWSGLPLVFDKVRVGRSASRQRRAEAFLKFFEKEGCRMVEMSCEEHDRLAAGTQFVTHTVGRVLGGMRLEATPIDTRGYESLLSLVDNTAHDSFDLYYGLFMYNQNATEELERLERAFDDVKTALFRRLHAALRSEVFDDSVSEDGRGREAATSDSISMAPASAAAARAAGAGPPASSSSSDEEEEEDDSERERAHGVGGGGNGAAAAGTAGAGAPPSRGGTGAAAAAAAASKG